MNSREYLENKIRGLSLRFNKIRIRYEHRSITQSHIVEILPLDLYEDNVDYLLEEEFIEEEFNAFYPDENILFVSEGSLTEVARVDFEIGLMEEVVFENDAATPYFEVLEFTNEVDTTGLNYALAA